MNNSRVYEDESGIRYKCVGFKNNQFKMEIIDSPVPEISEGITEWMDELPGVVEDNKYEPTYNLNP